MRKDIIFIILLLVVSPFAFLLMPAIGLIIGLVGLILLVKSIFTTQRQ